MTTSPAPKRLVKTDDFWADNPARTDAVKQARRRGDRRQERIRSRVPAVLAEPAPAAPAALVPSPRSPRAREADRLARAILGPAHPLVLAVPEPPAAVSKATARAARAVRSVAKKVSAPGQRPATEPGTEGNDSGEATGQRARETARLSAAGTAAAIGILRRDGEWALRDRARKITPAKRVADCGRTPHSGAVGVHAGHLSGLMMCDSVWSCAVHAPSIRNDRARDLDRKARAWALIGGVLVMVTTTIRHKPGDRLEPQMAKVAKAWKKMLSGRFRASFYDEFNVAGITRVIETTHGKNSWHTHIHALVWLRPDNQRATGADLAEKLRETLYKRWASRVAKEGLGVPNVKHGVHVQVMKTGEDGAADLAQYISKWSVGMELSREDRKKGGRNKHKTRTPFQILDDATDPATPDRQRVQDEPLWAEYVRASKGHQFMTWSGTIREELDELMEGEEPEEETPMVDPVASVMSGPWRRVVRRVAGRPLALVKAAEDGGRDAVFDLCHSWGLVIGVDVFVPDPSSGAVDSEVAAELTRQAILEWASRRTGTPVPGVDSAQNQAEAGADADELAAAVETWLARAVQERPQTVRIDAAKFARIHPSQEPVLQDA